MSTSPESRIDRNSNHTPPAEEPESLSVEEMEEQQIIEAEQRVDLIIHHVEQRLVHLAQVLHAKGIQVLQPNVPLNLRYAPCVQEYTEYIQFQTALGALYMMKHSLTSENVSMDTVHYLLHVPRDIFLGRLIMNALAGVLIAK